MKTVLITGATSGIGKATAFLFAKNNFRLILCGRRNDRLNSIKQELAIKTEVICLSFDVRDQSEVRTTLETLPANWNTIDILINNAGNAHGLAPIHEGNIQDWDAMIDINVKGLLYVSRSVIPGMVQRKAGHIINIGSMQEKKPIPMEMYIVLQSMLLML